MTADADDHALAWAGDEPLTAPVPKVVEVPPAEAKPGTPAALLVTYGILAGVYLIYTIGWVITIQGLGNFRTPSSDVLAEIMFQLGEALAITSPAIWFAAAFILTRGRKPIVRLLWLLVGLVAIVPWPFVIGAWNG